MDIRAHLLAGQVIPAHPLALTARRNLDERRQRALTRYYVASGAGGCAVGVHTTQFAIRQPQHGLYRPVLEIFRDTACAELAARPRPFVSIAGLCGRTQQAVAEAGIARSLGYDAGLLNLGACTDLDDAGLTAHCRAVAATIPLFGFYLQPAAGGRPLSLNFWRGFCEIEEVVAIKIAPFDRYETIAVMRAVAEAGRRDIALYTGNDDNIVLDLLTSYGSVADGRRVEARFAGGLLGQWAVWTRAAVLLLETINRCREAGVVPVDLLRTAAALTDANAAIFDAANGFGGCIPGINEVLRRAGLMDGVWCLDASETLSPGQVQEIDRVMAAYPELQDNAFVAEHLDEWLR